MDKNVLNLQIAEAEAQIARLSKSVAEMKAEANKPEAVKGPWVPQMGEAYWALGITGTVQPVTHTSHRVDYKCIGIGNCYRTEEEATNAVKKLKVAHQLRVLAKGFVPDWGNSSQTKWLIIFDHYAKKFKTEDLHYMQDASSVYFATRDEAEQAIKALGDELYVYFGMTPPAKKFGKTSWGSALAIYPHMTSEALFRSLQGE